jgi:hypothetical protein
VSFIWKNCAYTRGSLYPATSARSSTWLGLAAPHLIPTAPGAGKSAKPTLDLAIATFQIQMCWIPVRIPSPLGPLLPVHLTFDLVWMCCARCADYLNGVDLVQCGENGYRRVPELGPKVRQCIIDTSVLIATDTHIIVFDQVAVGFKTFLHTPDADELFVRRSIVRCSLDCRTLVAKYTCVTLNLHAVRVAAAQATRCWDATPRLFDHRAWLPMGRTGGAKGLHHRRGARVRHG